MKTTMLFFFFVALFGCINLLAEENTDTEQKHIIGATVGLQYPRINDEMGDGGDIFYRHCISSSPSAYYNKLYLSVDIGYAHFKNNEYIPITSGLHLYKKFGRYCRYYNIKIGALYKKEEKTFDKNSYDIKIKMLANFAIGYLIPLSKLSESLDLDINVQSYLIFKDNPMGKFSVGLSYSF